MLTIFRSTASRWRFIAVLMIAGVFAAACGSSSTTASPPAAGGSAASGAATVMAKSGPDGTYLTDGSGNTLYLFAPDTTSTSTCTGTCATFWPPLITTGAPQAGSGVTSSMLSTSKRADGSTQVVYNDHPLYRYLSDKAPGDITGQGINLSGGLWWIVSPSGAAIKTTASSSPSPASS
jgi:predicted lipoprotein with Yx(FWY)xxD motif